MTLCLQASMLNDSSFLSSAGIFLEDSGKALLSCPSRHVQTDTTPSSDMLMIFLKMNGLSLPIDFTPDDAVPASESTSSTSSETSSSSGANTSNDYGDSFTLPLYISELRDPFYSFDNANSRQNDDSIQAQSASAMPEYHSIITSMPNHAQQAGHFNQQDGFGTSQMDVYPSYCSHPQAHQVHPTGFAPANLGGPGSMPTLTDPFCK